MVRLKKKFSWRYRLMLIEPTQIPLCIKATERSQCGPTRRLTQFLWRFSEVNSGKNSVSHEKKLILFKKVSLILEESRVESAGMNLCRSLRLCEIWDESLASYLRGQKPKKTYFSELKFSICSVCCGLCLMTTTFKNDQNQCRELTCAPAPSSYPQPPRPSGTAVSDEDVSDVVSAFCGSDPHGRGEISLGSRARERWEGNGDGELVAEAQRGKRWWGRKAWERNGQLKTPVLTLARLHWHRGGAGCVSGSVCTRRRSQTNTLRAMLAIFSRPLVISSANRMQVSFIITSAPTNPEQHLQFI